MKISRLALVLLIATGLTITAASFTDETPAEAPECAAKTGAEICAPKPEEKPKSYHPAYL